MFDHVIPVAQGGRSVKGNIVYACHRCNAEKSGKTPAQWRKWRVARDLSWPPANPLDVTFTIVGGLSDEQAERLSPALRADFPPLTSALHELGDLVFADASVQLDEWRIRLCRIADDYASHTVI